MTVIPDKRVARRSGTTPNSAHMAVPGLRFATPGMTLGGLHARPGGPYKAPMAEAFNDLTLSADREARYAEVQAQRKLLDLQRDLAKVQAQLAFKPVSGGAQ